mmetsp:Transcript_86247/g.279201  ORF Transcript_86247/g.279201 Transcript_86247/m.279201 type:complete len:1268 (-) Transcript_86247:78-3881(-)
MGDLTGEGDPGEQPPSDDALAQELFGDFDSADEAAALPKGQQKRPRPEGAVGTEPADRQPTGDTHPAKRRKDIARFFETEAEEAGGSGDEEEDGDLEDLIDDSGVEPGEHSRSKARSQIQRQQQELDEVRREMAGRAGPSGESGASRVYGASFLDRMEEKYQAMQEDELAGAEPEPEGRQGLDVPAPPSPAVSQGRRKETNAFVVPDAKDPKLWAVRTFGPEKALCIALMRKSAEFFAQGKPVSVFSVFYSDHLRGYIYVEAFRESDVRDFCRGITGISVWDIKIVPVTQMPQVFMASAVDADKRTLIKAGDWVRVKRGLYKGDLAQVDEVKDDIYVVKLKPRLQYGLESQGKMDRDERAHRKRAQPRWFNRADIEAGGLIVSTEKRFTPKGYLTFFIVDDDSYRDGFLYKSFKSHWFEVGDRVRAQEHELQDWRFAPPVSENTRPAADIAKTDESKLMPPPTTLPKKSIAIERSQLVEGDVVIVHSGDLKNLRGVVTQALFGSTTVLVQPLDVANIEGELNISISLLSKYFQVGDYVKAIGGENEGDTGYVLKVMLDDKKGWGYNAMARVLSMSVTGEFNARIDHLRLTAQRPDPQDTVGEFSVEQLVRLEGRQNSRGMIVRLEAGARAIVLTTDGKKHDVSFGDLEPVALPPRGMYCNKVWTLDRRGTKIIPDALVKAPRTTTRAAPIKANVLYIHNNFCFLKAVEALTGERAYLVCPGSKCEFVFARAKEKRRDQEVKEPAKEAKEAQGSTSYGVTMESETSWLKPWFKKMMGLKEERGTPNSIQSMGTSVRIHGGSYKGLRGEVRDYLGDKVRVSLLAKPKLVVVSINNIAPDDYERPRAERFPETSVAPSTPVASPGSPGAAGFLEDEGHEPVDDFWGTPRTPEPPLPPPRPSPDTASGPAATAAAPPKAASDTDEASSRVVLPTRKRRASRIPRDGAEAGAEGRSPRDGESPRVSQSPSTLFGHVPSHSSDREVRASWLIAGLGVRYTHESQPCLGWILKVYADTVHVVPDSAEVGDDTVMHPLKGHETRPWLCDARGEMALVFDGPRRGTKGKVIGFEKTCAYIRIENENKGKHSLLFASASGSDLVRVERKDIARFSPAWEKAAEEKQKRPAVPVVPDTPDGGAPSESDKSGKKALWDAASDASRGQDEAMHTTEDEQAAAGATPAPAASPAASPAAPPPEGEAPGPPPEGEAPGAPHKAEDAVGEELGVESPPWEESPSAQVQDASQEPSKATDGGNDAIPDFVLTPPPPAEEVEELE